MCGIVGYIGPRQAAGLLLEGLRRLEYRGYDSSGIAVVNGHGLEIRKAAGKLSMLEQELAGGMPGGTLGIGHTRWATHGAPTTPNAHPHTDQSGRIAVIHNGIIENSAAIRKTLERRGHTFTSETDTEVLAHLVGAPWVAHRVWPMPRVPPGMPPASSCSSMDSLPAALRTSRPWPFTTAMPEES